MFINIQMSYTAILVHCNPTPTGPAENKNNERSRADRKDKERARAEWRGVRLKGRSESAAPRARSSPAAARPPRARAARPTKRLVEYFLMQRILKANTWMYNCRHVLDARIILKAIKILKHPIG